MRIGLLGTGPWARTAHAPALAAHPEVEFTGVWGRRPEAAGELAALHGTRAYEDLDALLADVDAVAVALPPSVQAELAARAARAGRHLLLDKPVATTVAGARALAGAVREAEVASVVFFTTRFQPATEAWIAEQSARGGWFTARAEWLGAVFTGDSPYAASPWRREKGALWDVGPHALSVLLPVLGDVTRVRAAGRGPGDTVHGVLEHAGGASSTVTLSLTAPVAAAGVGVEFRGESGVTSLPGATGTVVEAFGRAVDTLVEAAGAPPAGRGVACDAAFGLRVTEILAELEEVLGARG
ncbi:MULTISPECIES: Gfo/Idh/MocA family protein [Streptomyces]|uniref:Oxidoreductase n=2 Tax=Streptomyces griseoaurantiacus TaxID=68213 RepID=F3NHW6_9ACTN|nr:MULTISPECIES: Gfo/Idh/MocA family oxidoreductase [Streptomyces]EGG47006.1 oxidoreductase [Streptomyces griseoaurantiacus M045]MBA5225494.1 Gfo/Idh/MocA family oxidoreductase [Streptomyces griseoaurantiacus]MCF0088257.1 Glucose--fructose oxidoreductase [Streptomyces sp. MH192]MCF0102152.1 Glucose--fructose oxidoreductase [Streptomyces sp. MH191]MDX3089439.1 Gfo/Idh/MocA family oxidoreductase [Streptomyces sp. ME12-02E]